MNNIIHAEQLSYKFGSQLAVDKITLTLDRGEVMALLGTNGAGKTTTLRLLTGELIPNTGTILINDIDLNLHPVAAKRYLGYLPDVPPLYGDLTVDEFLFFCARLRGINKSALRACVNQVKEFCELRTVSSRLIKKLSKGYQQRVGIAQAIVHRPPAIILDEPTNGLDPGQILEMRDLIVHLRNNAGVLLSTHQLTEVEQICDRVQLLKDGKTVLEKNLDQLKQVQRIRLRFTGSVPQQEIQAFQEVHTLSIIDEHTLEIDTSGDLDVLKNSLLAESQLNGWNLVEIYDVHEALEDIFVRQILRGKQ